MQWCVLYFGGTVHGPSHSKKRTNVTSPRNLWRVHPSGGLCLAEAPGVLVTSCSWGPVNTLSPLRSSRVLGLCHPRRRLSRHVLALAFNGHLLS